MAETEKKKASWELVKAILTVTYPDSEKVGFDMSLIYPEFMSLKDTVKETLCYGAKQKMSDACARPKDEKLTQNETIAQMQKTFKDIVSGEAWSRKSGGGAISYKTKLTNNMDKLSPEEQKAFRDSMAKMGMMLEG